jgi:hypothetical protein
MVMKSIEQVYSQPKFHNDKSKNPILTKASDIYDLIKTLSDMVKNVKI